MLVSRIGSMMPLSASINSPTNTVLNPNIIGLQDSRAIRSGSFVVIHGLQSDQGKTLNGQCAKVMRLGTGTCGGDHGENVRHELQLLDASTKAIKSANLWKPDFDLGTRVEIHSVTES
eukprot:GSA25T00000521001.1